VKKKSRDMTIQALLLYMSSGTKQIFGFVVMDSFVELMNYIESRKIDYLNKNQG
jgi:hypothetical protein